MKVHLDADVHHLTRVEGHGNIRVRVREGVLEEARWQVVETPRFFEVMMRKKHFSTVPILAARVCGICSIAHCLCSLEATEDAFGLTVPEPAKKLRLLAKHGETLQSHALHLFFLAAPDFLDVPSVLPLVQTHPHVVELARRLKGLANRLCDGVAGRTTHPVTLQVGGVSAAPKRDALLRFRDELVRSRDDWHTAAELFRGLEQPDFERPTEFVSLGGQAGYPFIGRSVVSTDGVALPAEEYLALTNEYLPPASTSKWCKLSRASFAVGPLARFNNNAAKLQPPASDLASTLGLEPVCHKPFFAHLARLVECVQATEECLCLIDELVEPGAMEPLRTAPVVRAGRGVGAVEAPRGILYHAYEYDADGRIVSADCVIPTTQNHANIQHDLESLVAERAPSLGSDEALERLCSMLVRSYDPCISCSVH